MFFVGSKRMYRSYALWSSLWGTNMKRTAVNIYERRVPTLLRFNFLPVPWGTSAGVLAGACAPGGICIPVQLLDGMLLGS